MVAGRRQPSAGRPRSNSPFPDAFAPRDAGNGYDELREVTAGGVGGPRGNPSAGRRRSELAQPRVDSAASERPDSKPVGTDAGLGHPKPEWNADFSSGPSALDQPPPPTQLLGRRRASQPASSQQLRVGVMPGVTSGDRRRGLTPETAFDGRCSGACGSDASSSSAAAGAARSGSGAGSRREGNRAVLAAANGRAAANGGVALRDRGVEQLWKQPDWNSDFGGPLLSPMEEPDPKAPQWFNEMRGGTGLSDRDASPLEERGGRGSASAPVQRPQNPSYSQQQQQAQQQRPQLQRPQQSRRPAAEQQQQQQQQQQAQAQAAAESRGAKNVERALPTNVGAKSWDTLAAEEEATANGRGNDLVKCDMCGRNFALDRIEKHKAACAKQAAKPRRTFNAAKQRLGEFAATDPQAIDIKRAARDDVRREAVKADVRRGATEPGFHAERPAARDAEPPPARKAPQVMLGKDGRPLSPLSSALARAKAGLDPEDDDDVDESASDLVPCPCCGRNFARERLATHLPICQKVTMNSMNRSKWDAREQRIDKDKIPESMSPARLPKSRGRPGNGMLSSTGVGADRWKHHSVPVAARSASHDDDDYDGRLGSAAARDRNRAGSAGRAVLRSERAERMGSAASSSSGGGGFGGGGGAGNVMPANKLPKWKRDHMAFQAAMTHCKQNSGAEASGMPPPECDDRTPCPHCGRRFNALAAERHIPKCQAISAKPKMLTRGGGVQAVSSASRQRSGSSSASRGGRDYY